MQRITLAILAAVVLTTNGVAKAESTDQLPMSINCENVLFSMVDLSDDQCQLSIEDVEQKFTPEVKLEHIGVNVGSSYLGGVYLSSWTFAKDNNQNTFASIQLFKSDHGQYALVVHPDLSYKNLAGDIDLDKISQFFVLIGNDSKPIYFKERLSYDARKAGTYDGVRVEGKSRYDSSLHIVPQSVDVKDGTVSFTRTTDTGVKITASCRL